MKIKRLACLSLALVSMGTFAVGCANGGVSGIPGNTVQTSDANNMNYSDIIAKLQDIDSKQDALDRQEKDLKNKYRNGQITKEEYTAQMSEIDRQKAELDREEDELEIRLDALKGGTQAGGNMAGATTAATQAATTTQATTKATTAQTTTATPPSSAAGNGNANRESILRELAELDIKDDELDLQEDQLEYQYRMGQIDRNTFLNKKAEIERQELEINAKENELQLKLYNSYYSPNATSDASAGTANNNITVPNAGNSDLMSIKRRLNEIDLLEDELELKYARGQISRADFISQKSKLEAEEDALDRQEDWLEGDFD